MAEFRMPALGAEMEAGTLVQWLKQPGDTLARGDIVAVVETEKGAIEIEVFEPCVLERILVEPGQRVPVGTPLAIMAAAQQGAPSPAPPATGRRASPAARRAAESLTVDLAEVVGTGPGGAITREDVERAAGRQAVAPAAEAERAEAVARTAAMRTAIAAAMSRSKREIPHLYLSTTIDMTRPLAWLSAENLQRSVDRRLLAAVLLVKAVAHACAEIPELNGFWIDGAFRQGRGVHVGCAIALRDGGLVAPAIHDADGKPLDTVMADLMDLVARARRGTLRSSELADPTITLTNLGELGVESAFGVIHPPQVALIAFGRILPRPWVIDGRVEARSLLTATLSVDHRAVDGRRGGQFLDAVDRRLQAPETL